MSVDLFGSDKTRQSITFAFCLNLLLLKVEGLGSAMSISVRPETARKNTEDRVDSVNYSRIVCIKECA